MEHVYYEGDTARPLIVLLHGTGGDEHDLIDLGRKIDSNAALLGIRGEVTEHGMPRFFKRLSPGVFDMEDLNTRSDGLRSFIGHFAEAHGYAMDKVIVLGYSNGANILAHMLLKGFDLTGVILMHPMTTDVDLNTSISTKVLITAGINDEMVPYHMTESLKSQLEHSGAEVTMSVHHMGHQLTLEELEKTAEWYAQTFV